MKRISALLITVLLSVILVTTLAVTAFAEDGVQPAASGNVFEYTSGGVKKYADSSVDFATVISNADAGSTIYMLDDYTVESSQNGPIARITKKITVDMQGHTFTMRDKCESTANNGQISIYISTSNEVTFKNGTIVAGHITSTYKSAAYPFFHFGTNNATLTLENVNSYLATLVYSYGNYGVTLNIKGGEHHSILKEYGCDGGLINTRASITVNATDARFYMDNEGWLISSMHSKQTSGTVGSTHNYTNCVFLTVDDNVNLIKYANEKTKVYFNGCTFLGGKFDPAVTNTETNAGYSPMKTGGVVFGMGCAWVDSFDYGSVTVFSQDSVCAQRTDTVSASYSMSTGNLCDGFSIGKATSKTYQTAYKLVDPDDIEKVTVYWRDASGNLLQTTKAPMNASATPPTLDSYERVNNGWYTQVYDGWSLTPGGAPDRELIATEGKSFYLTRGSVEVGLKLAKYNLKLMGHVQINLFIPTAAPAGVKILGVYPTAEAAATSKGAFESAGVAYLSDVAYLEYVLGTVGATALSTTKSAFLKYEVNVDGRSTVLVQQMNLSAIKYMETVLADSDKSLPTYPSAVHRMIANIVRYSYTLSDVARVTRDTKLVSLYNDYVSRLLTDIDNTHDNDFPESDLSIGELGSYIKSISFEVGSYQPRYRVIFKENSGVTDMKISLEGWYAGGEGSANWTRQTFSYDPSSVLYYDSRGQYVNSNGKVCDEMGTVIAGKTAGTKTDKIAVLYSDSIQIYNIDRDMTITLTVGNTTVSGQYDIDSYYNGIKGSTATSTLTKVRLFLKAMRAYGSSVVAYRFATGKDPVGEDVEKTISYKDFGAVGDGVTDDFEAIRTAHEYANKFGYSVKAEKGDVYYIGNSTKGQSVIVKTNTYWNGAKFIFDDSDILTHTSCGCNDCAVRGASIFKVDSTVPVVSVLDVIKQNLPLSNSFDGVGTTKLKNWTLGYDALVHISSSERRVFIRTGANADSGDNINEVILVRKDGTIDSSTPLSWDYNNITSAYAYNAEEAPVVIDGGGAIIETIANRPENNEYIAYSRNISVQRSNTTIRNFTHVVQEEQEFRAPYTGILHTYRCNNTTYENIVLQAARRKYVASNNQQGTYEIGANSANDIKFINVNASNFFATGANYDYNSYGVLHTAGQVGNRGMMGTNYCRNFYFKGCRIVNFDAHKGLGNLTIEDCELQNILVMGAGNIVVKNTVCYADSSRTVITYRGDYGASFRGNIEFDNVELKYSKESGTEFTLIKLNYEPNNDYDTDYNSATGTYEAGLGSTNYMGTNIYIKNVKMTAYKMLSYIEKNADGYNDIEEQILTANASLYVFNKSISTGYTYYLYDISKFKSEGGYSNKNRYIAPEKIVIENRCSNLVLPSTKTFKQNTKVTVDGKQVTL